MAKLGKTGKLHKMHKLAQLVQLVEMVKQAIMVKVNRMHKQTELVQTSLKGARLDTIAQSVHSAPMVELAKTVKPHGMKN